MGEGAFKEIHNTLPEMPEADNPSPGAKNKHGLSARAALFCFEMPAGHDSNIPYNSLIYLE